MGLGLVGVRGLRESRGSTGSRCEDLVRNTLNTDGSPKNFPQNLEH